MSTPDRNFLGIPIDGDISKGPKRASQRPLSDLEPLIRAVLADETIDSFGWNQYTPYFNDGEPCVFGVTEPWFRTVDDVKPASNDDEDYDEEYDDDRYGVLYGDHPSLGKREYHWAGTYPNRTKEVHSYEGPDEDRFNRCVALAEAISSDAFDNVLLDAFGDHCRVKIRRDGITIDEYSHD